MTKDVHKSNTRRVKVDSIEAQNNKPQHDKAEELARSNQLMLALSQVATQLQTISNPDQVHETLGNELKKFGITCLIGISDPEDEAIVVKYSSIESKILSMAEQLAGKSLLGHRFP